MALVNSYDDSTIGFLVEKENPDDENGVIEDYQPSIMWNLHVKGYIFIVYTFTE